MEKGGGSRLLQMQARFQQKQLQERELKIASLYEAQQARALDKVRLSPSNTSTNTNSSTTPTQPPVHPGKVRQMFEERRTKAGIDKSYPLQPIHNTERAKPRNPLPNGYSKVTSSRIAAEKKITNSNVTSTHSMKKQIIHKSENIVNVSGDMNHNHELDLNLMKNTNQINGDFKPSDEVDKAQNNGLLEDETFPEALEPEPTPRSPEPKVEVKKPALRNSITKRAASPAKPKPQMSTVTSVRRGANENVPEAGKQRAAMQRVTNSVIKKTPASPSSKTRSAASVSGAGTAGEGDACAICGRRFASDRLAKHQEICKKSHAKKRKPFDVLKHRLAGTEAEPFIGKLRKSTAQSSKPDKQLNSTWRQKHEEFIQAIRAAKQVQAHLKAGGKLSDLPPPPPSENPDYVQCPHCSRRFNKSAAERHIPKCANYQFNKPKASKRR